MKTLKDYGDQINNRKKLEEERKVSDSLSFIKENQLNFNKKNKDEEFSIDKNAISSASFLQTHESHLNNNFPDFRNDPKRSFTINTGKLIVKSVNTGHVLMNEFEYKGEISDGNEKTPKLNNNGMRNNSSDGKNKSKDGGRSQKFTKKDDSIQNMSSIFRTISGIEDKRNESQEKSMINMLSSSQNSLFLGAGKTLLRKIDEEYLKIIENNKM